MSVQCAGVWGREDSQAQTTGNGADFQLEVCSSEKSCSQFPEEVMPLELQSQGLGS